MSRLITLPLLFFGFSAFLFSQTEFAIYRFPNSALNGAQPNASLIADKGGNLYGTTTYGGAGRCSGGAVIGCGTVFRLTPPAHLGGSWAETVIYNFQGGSDGYFPFGGVVSDQAGNLYGTTWSGGPNSGGTVFELTLPVSGSTWTKSILYAFGADFGALSPSGGLAFDAKGNLYGTTGVTVVDDTCHWGGAAPLCGTVFKLAKPSIVGGPWTHRLLYSFGVSPFKLFGDGPTGSLALDTKGNVYGTTVSGGTSGLGQCADWGCGTVFELTPPASAHSTWTATQLRAFQDGSGDGLVPEAGLLMDTSGNLYGSTAFGGTGGSNDSSCQGPGVSSNCGTIFELLPSVGGWSETIIYDFQGNGDAARPQAKLIFDKAGNIYGTTLAGGGASCPPFVIGCGTVFRLSPPGTSGQGWTETVLHAFTGSDGQFPDAGLIFSNDALYGTTSEGGESCPPGTGYTSATCGVVFKIVP
ncbi:MAG TPA: choice-of-anchor tandem repeat GloVer-containing protein [Candidatus Sulfotelmatobacter sp.]